MSGINMRGYTIIEVLIFLAVSGGLAVFALNSIGGKQGRTEFALAAQEFQTQMNDYINDVATGYNVRMDNFSCVAGATGDPVLTISASPVSLGTNNTCIFVGQAIQFGTTSLSNGTKLRLFPIVGRRYAANTTNEAQSLNDASVIAIAPRTTSPAGFPDATQEIILPGRATIGYVRSNDGAVTDDLSTIAFVTNFSTISGGNLQSDSRSADMLVLSTSVLTHAKTSISNLIAAISNTTMKNPKGGVTICINSSGSGQSAKLLIGSNGRELNTQLTIEETRCV